MQIYFNRLPRCRTDWQLSVKLSVLGMKSSEKYWQAMTNLSLFYNAFGYFMSVLNRVYRPCPSGFRLLRLRLCCAVLSALSLFSFFCPNIFLPQSSAPSVSSRATRPPSFSCLNPSSAMRANPLPISAFRFPIFTFQSAICHLPSAIADFRSLPFHSMLFQNEVSCFHFGFGWRVSLFSGFPRKPPVPGCRRIWARWRTGECLPIQV